MTDVYSDRLNIKTMRSKNGYLNRSKKLVLDDSIIYLIVFNFPNRPMQSICIGLKDEIWKGKKLPNYCFKFMSAGRQDLSCFKIHEDSVPLILGKIATIPGIENVLDSEINKSNFDFNNLDAIEVIQEKDNYYDYRFRIYINKGCRYEFYLSFGKQVMRKGMIGTNSNVIFNTNYTLDNGIIKLKESKPETNTPIIKVKQFELLGLQVHTDIESSGAHSYDLGYKEWVYNTPGNDMPYDEIAKFYKSKTQKLLVLKIDDNAYHYIRISPLRQGKGIIVCYIDCRKSIIPNISSIDMRIDIADDYKHLLFYAFRYDSPINYTSAVLKNNNLIINRYNFETNLPLEPVEMSVMKPVTYDVIKKQILYLSKENIS